jgi:hypothetical protein
MSALAVDPRRGREALLVTSMPERTGEDDELLRLAAAGDGANWQALVGRSRDRLRRMVAFRLDQGVQEKASGCATCAPCGDSRRSS